MTEQSQPGALDGLRVIDLTRILAGPFCTMLLGDMGADIIKVEQPGRGDDTRAWGPPFVGEESAYFLGANRNKRGMTLNLKHDAGQEILGELLRNADVVIDNFKLGTMTKFGFDDAWYQANAPQIVRCSILGYGSSQSCVDVEQDNSVVKRALALCNSEFWSKRSIPIKLAYTAKIISQPPQAIMNKPEMRLSR